MKRIIDIPEEVIEAFENGDINFSYYDYNSVIGKAIRNSTPLDECDDCISRERALEPYRILEPTDTLSVYTIRKNLTDLPTVYPKSDKPSGKWIRLRNGQLECSKCYTRQNKELKYCPYCGAKMESEDKE